MQNHKTNHNILLLILLLLVFALVNVLVGCQPTQQVPTQQVPKNLNNQQAYIIQLDFVKFDSLCIIDTLPKNLKYWNKIELRDYESKNISTQYMYNKNDSIYIIDIISDIISDSQKSDTVIYKRIIYQP